jgi:DNA-binding response OmpR family regulator
VGSVESRPTIFVVEDDPDVNRLIRVNLENAGFMTEPFSNVMSALAKARFKPPSLFLLDIMMPGEDGLGFASGCAACRNSARPRLSL